MGALGGLAQGLLAGRELRMRMQKAMDEHQALQQEIAQRQQAMAMQAHDAALKVQNDNLDMLLRGGKPVTNGMVEDMMSWEPGKSQNSQGPSSQSQSENASQESRLPVQQAGINGYSTSPLDQLRAQAGGGDLPLDTSRLGGQQPSASGGVPQSFSYLRKAKDVTTIPGLNGEKWQYEMPSPEEQIARQAQMKEAAQLREKLGAAKAESAAELFLRNLKGQKAPDDVAQFYGLDPANPYNKFYPAELQKMRSDMAEARAKGMVKLEPGTLLDDITGVTGGAPVSGAVPGAPIATGATGPSTPGQATAGARVVATGGPPLPTDDFGKYFLPAFTAKTLNKPLAEVTAQDMKSLDPDLVKKAFGEFSAAKESPDTVAMRKLAMATQSLHETMLKLQAGQMPTRDDAKAAAQIVINHQLSPQQAATMYGGFGTQGQAFKRMMMGEITKIDPQFNFEEAESEYQLAKSPQFQQTVRYMDSVQESIPLVIQRAQQLANGNVRSINSLLNAGKNQFNNIDLKRFQTDRLLVADEIAKILQGGGTGSATSDAKLNQAGEILKASDSPQAIAAGLGDVQQLIGYRRKALTRGTYLERTQLQAAGGLTVTYQGHDYTFKDQASMAQFKKDQGIQ